MTDDWWPARRRHLRSTPPADGLRRMARSVAPGSVPVRTRRLRGGLGTSTHVVTLRKRSGAEVQVVLKRYPEFGEMASREWGRNVYAATLRVPSPEPVANDPDGEWFGAPSFVVSKLPGRPYLDFEGDDAAYAEIASTILEIASAPRSRLPAIVRQPPIASGTWMPPNGLQPTPFVRRAVAEVRRLRPAAMRQERVMSHGDFHPGNMLWSRGRISGLVDWGSCNLAYRTRDVVYCRTEVAVLYGLREADRFLRIYESVAGERLQHVKVWDLMQGLTAMRWCPWWAYAYREQGRTDLTAEIALRRARAFVRRALG